MASVAITAAVPDPSLLAEGDPAYAGGMSDRLEDSALMLRYRDGDAAAFETLYRRHNAPLYRYLVRLCLNRDTAEDLFQEAWAKIIRSRGNYRASAKFSTYLFHVAHNCFVDHVRRNRRYATSADTAPEPVAEPGDEPEQQTEKLLARIRLHSALEALPDEQRDAFLLYEEGSLTIDEIARVTGVNRETAKSRLRYAVDKLKVSMAAPRSPRERRTE